MLHTYVIQPGPHVYRYRFKTRFAPKRAEAHRGAPRTSSIFKSRIFCTFAPGNPSPRIPLTPEKTTYLDSLGYESLVGYLKLACDRNSRAIITRIMFHLGFRVLLSTMQGQAQIPLYSEISLLYSKIIMFSWGADPQKKCKGHRRNSL